PAAGERRQGPFGGHGTVEVRGEQPVDEVLGDLPDGGHEAVVVGHPGVVAPEFAAQQFQGAAGAGVPLQQLAVVEFPELGGVFLPLPELAGHGAAAQQAGTVEVVDVVDGVGDVVGDVHDGAL